MCRDAFSLVERAFTEQETRIALINLSHSEYGPLLAMHSLLNDRKFELRDALDLALNIVNEGKDSAILYYESSGGTSEYFGIALERKVVGEIGQSLDRIEGIMRKGGQPFDYYDVAYVAQNADQWLREFKEKREESAGIS